MRATKSLILVIRFIEDVIDLNDRATVIFDQVQQCPQCRHRNVRSYAVFVVVVVVPCGLVLSRHIRTLRQSPSVATGSAQSAQEYFLGGGQLRSVVTAWKQMPVTIHRHHDGGVTHWSEKQYNRAPGRSRT